MKRFLELYLLGLLAILIFSCNEEEILPQNQPVKIAKAAIDSSKVITPAAHQHSTAIFPDSAFYQYGNIESMPYRFMVPRKYDSATSYPLVVFLHGIDERGTDNEKQLKWGASLFQSDSASKGHPAFVVFPQCPQGNYWFDTVPSQTLKHLIDNMIAKYNVDRNRIYIVGISMGAYGTYAAVAANPGLFSAAIAISGDGDHSKAKEMAMTNWRIFAGKKDEIVPSEKSEKIAKALKDSGASVTLKVYPDADHVGSWVKAFAENDFLPWLFANQKSSLSH
jgi:predicted peptidase